MVNIIKYMAHGSPTIIKQNIRYGINYINYKGIFNITLNTSLYNFKKNILI